MELVRSQSRRVKKQGTFQFSPCYLNEHAVAKGAMEGKV